MTNIIVLVIVVFLTNGAPVATVYALPETAACDEQVALRYARDYAGQFPDLAFQEQVLWNCLPVQSIGPGPAMRPAMYPGVTEATR